MILHRYAFCAFMLASLVVGCRPAPSGKPTESAGIKTDTPKKKPMRRAIEQPATIEAFEETPLQAHISGYLERVNVDIGKTVKGPIHDAKGEVVKPGEILAVIAVPDMVRELEQKTALVAQTRAEVEQAVASLKATEAHILTAKALVREATASCVRADANFERWKSEFQRVEKAVKDGVLDKQIREETLYQYKSADATRQEVEAKVLSAQANAEETEAQRDKAKADVTAARARVQVALAAEGKQQALVEYRNIRAPFDGVVTQRNVHTGRYVQPQSGVLFVVAKSGKLRVFADIPETEAMYVVDDLAVKLRLPTLRDQIIDAKVTRTSWTHDPKSRTLRIEIDVPGADTKLRPGMFANVSFDIDLGTRFTLPASAIFTHADQPNCWRVVEGKAVRTALKLGVRDGQLVEVVKMNVNAVWQDVTGQEEVVVTNLGAVNEGKEVRVERK